MEVTQPHWRKKVTEGRMGEFIASPNFYFALCFKLTDEDVNTQIPVPCQFDGTMGLLLEPKAQVTSSSERLACLQSHASHRKVPSKELKVIGPQSLLGKRPLPRLTVRSVWPTVV